MLTVARDASPNLEAKVAFLSTPSSYPEGPRSVLAHETHMSWVFLTDRHAFKLKKPVKTSFLDFSTLERRRHFCEEEIRLNRSLAPGIYLDVVPLGCDRFGGLLLGEGEAVDYLVRMRRLPAEATLEASISAHHLEERKVRALAVRLAAFYRTAPVVHIDGEEYRRRIAADIDENALALVNPRYGLPVAIIETVAGALRKYAADQGRELERRAKDHRIVDAHGDLRPEHIYFLADQIVVIDRLEFNEALRQLDSADELAYLAMECDRAGASSVGPWIFGTYGAETGDRPSPLLVAFYKCARAMLRAKLAIWHLDTPRPRTPEKWPAQALAYLNLARSYAQEL